MPINLKNRSLLSLVNHTPDEIDYLVSLAEDLKKAKRAGTERPLLCGKSIALIFEKTSTRTRSAFEVAAYDQGANTMKSKIGRAPTRLSLTRPSPRSVIKKASRIPPAS